MGRWLSDPLSESNNQWSGCRDLNPGPLDPQSSALTKLRHSPSRSQISTEMAAHGDHHQLERGAPAGETLFWHGNGSRW